MGRVIVRKLRTAMSLPLFTLLWLGPVWCLLGVCRLAILTLPLRWMSGFYGVDVGVCPWSPLATPQQISRARAIRRTIGLAAGYSPWVANCYPQALTARILMGLYRVPYAIHFGLRRDEKTREMLAHAWVVCGPVSVTGGQSFGRFTVVRSFVSRGVVAGGFQGKGGTF